MLTAMSGEAGVQVVDSEAQASLDPRMAASARLCRPASSKFPGFNHRAKPRFTAGHSVSSMAYQAVSRLRPFTIICWRNTPSKVKPSRLAAARGVAFNALHFHS